MADPEQLRKTTLILGMHRSGTSALARVVNLLGVQLSPDLMRAREAVNERGFFESEAVVDLHDRLLERLSVEWSETFPLPEAWWRRADVIPLRDELAALLREHFDAQSWWGIKDPRLCRLLPLWRSVLAELRCEPLCLLITRNPCEVADSLARRDGLLPAHAHQLWLDHVLAAEEHSRGLTRAFVNYSDLLEDWRGTLERAGQQLGVDWPGDYEAATGSVQEFLSPTLRHHVAPDEMLASDSEISPWIKASYAELVRAGREGETPGFRERLEGVRREVRAAEMLYHPALVRSQSAIRERDARVARAREEMRARDRELRLLRREFEERSQALIDARKHAASQDARVDQAVEAQRSADEEAKTSRAWALNQQSEIERLRGIIEVRNARIEDIQRELGRRGGEALSRTAELGHAVHELNLARGQLADAQARLADEGTGRADALREASDLKRQLAEAGHLLGEARRDLAETHEQVARLADLEARAEAGAAQQAEQVASLESETKRLAGLLAAREHELGQIFDSTTWRLTRWPRSFWHAFRFGPLRRAHRRLASRRQPGDPAPEVEPERDEAPAETAAAAASSTEPELGPEPEPSPRVPPAAMSQPKPAATESVEPVAPAPPLLSLPTSPRPVVSIVVPVYDHWDCTLACLRSLAERSSDLAYEVIVVDDASTDETRELPRLVSGVRVLRSDENRGFVESCNRGAREARGEFLVFLNNDTEVQEGWLDALLETFSKFRDVGAVGARLVGPDGRLQEAGGIIWSDGNGWNFGRGDDPARPEYSFVREVDYCSGACLMLRRDDFFEVGGFDARYAPAYYEDVDLCFALRETGRRVLYQPRACVMHLEGVTAGRDLETGVKRFQVVNRERFVEKWREALAAQPAPDTDLRIARQRGIPHHILVVDARTPMPDNDAGSLRMFRILEILARLGCRVTFSSEIPYHVGDYTRAIEEIGVEVLYPTAEAVSLQQFLEQRGSLYDTVILSRFYVGRNWSELVRQCCPRARLVLDTVLRERREADVWEQEHREPALLHVRYEELAAARAADLTLVVSDEEKALLAEEAPDVAVDVLPTIHRTKPDGPGFEDREGILFIGSFQHPPNVDAIRYYTSHIHGPIQELLPGVALTVVGADVPAELQELASDTIRFVGKVEDIDPLFDAARLSIAPLRYGAGVKGKINTSLSLGVPVVTTSVGAEGLGALAGRDLLVADDPREFAETCARLYHEPDLWQKLREDGMRAVEAGFSFGVAETALRRVLGLHQPEAGSERVSSGTDQERRLEVEIERYRDVEEVHDLPEIFHYWSNRFLPEKLGACGIRGIDELFLDPILAACRSRSDGEIRVASLGAGNADLEVRLSRRLVDEGCSNFRFHCLELNPHMIERGRALAESQGVESRICFEQIDLSEWDPDGPFAVCMASHTLHHIVQLESVFDAVKRAIGPGGVFVVHDMIGRNGHMRWPEALEIVQSIWQTMPDRYKHNRPLRRFETEFQNWDCSSDNNEGVRAQDILPLLMERFHFEVFLAFANLIDVFVDRVFGPNFDPELEEDRKFIEYVARLDEEKIDVGQIKPTHLMGVLRTEPTDHTTCWRHWTPQFCLRRP
jgi:GT2 family glycosyltransferase/glycosyltransferase involved in cell wall biosynthesis/SAM-dependent methyltransferase